MFNYTPKHIIDEQRKIERLKKEQEAELKAKMKALYNKAVFKPGDMVRHSNGQIYYIDKINFNTECYEMYALPFNNSQYDLAKAMSENRHKNPGVLNVRYMMSINNDMTSFCDVSSFTPSPKIICTRCYGHGLVNAQKTTYTEGIEEKRRYEYRSGDLYFVTYDVPVYYSKKTWVGATCPVCNGVGHAKR